MQITLLRTWHLVRLDPSRPFLQEMRSAFIIYSAAAVVGMIGVTVATIVGFPPTPSAVGIVDGTSNKGGPPEIPPIEAPPQLTPPARTEPEFLIGLSKLRRELETIAEKSGDQQWRLPKMGERVPKNVRTESLPPEIIARMRTLGLPADVAGVFESQDNLILIDPSRKVVSILPSGVAVYGSTPRPSQLPLTTGRGRGVIVQD